MSGTFPRVLAVFCRAAELLCPGSMPCVPLVFILQPVFTLREIQFFWNVFKMALTNPPRNFGSLIV